jgi:hypothetical protein
MNEEDASDQGENLEAAFFQCYAGFSKTLRAWLVAYGIGAPALFASQNAFARLLQKTDLATTIFVTFLAGVALQVVAALIYKTCMWYMYWGASNAGFQKSLRYRLCGWVTEQYWLELLFDVGAITLFAWATVQVLLDYVASTPPCVSA